jgi:hypothetical protein
VSSHVVNSSRLAHSDGESFVDDAQGGFEERICLPGAGAEELPGVAERRRSEASALLDYSEKVRLRSQLALVSHHATRVP